MREKTEEQLIECGKYYDVLDNFDKTIHALNVKAASGEGIKNLQLRCLKLLPSFILLCGDAQRKVKKTGPKKRKVEKNLTVKNGWGICPACGGKCIKVQQDTILLNYPMFCKHCKNEQMVNWQLSR